MVRPLNVIYHATLPKGLNFDDEELPIRCDLLVNVSPQAPNGTRPTDSTILGMARAYRLYTRLATVGAPTPRIPTTSSRTFQIKLALPGCVGRPRPRTQGGRSLADPPVRVPRQYPLDPPPLSCFLRRIPERKKAHGLATISSGMVDEEPEEYRLGRA